MANYLCLLLFVIAHVLRRRAEHSLDIRPGDKFYIRRRTKLVSFSGFGSVGFFACVVVQWRHFLLKVRQQLVGDCAFLCLVEKV